MYRTVRYNKEPNSDFVYIILCEETSGDTFSDDMYFFDVNNIRISVLRKNNFKYTRNGNILLGEYRFNPTAYPSDARYLQLGDYRVGVNGVHGNKRGYL